MANYTAYTRVSSAKQAKSGLGLAAQRQRIRDFAVSDNVVEWFEDRGESGAKDDRAGLERALHACELTGSTLLIATLDRLTRDVAFLEAIKRRCEAGGFEFKCCDMPEANSFMLGIMGQLAQYEREQIGDRTRRAMKAAKAKATAEGRELRFGNPAGVAAFQGRQAVGVARAAESHRTRADQWASKRQGIMEELVEAGLSLSAMARELTAKRITTRNGGAWTAQGVRNLIDRLGLELVAA
jgi:DNA invertase Pin-like site-specific DNA recombinase